MRATLFTSKALCLFFITPTLYAAVPSSFSAAKNLAESQVYYDQDETFYCGCDFTFEGGPDLASGKPTIASPVAAATSTATASPIGKPMKV